MFTINKEYLIDKAEDIHDEIRYFKALYYKHTGKAREKYKYILQELESELETNKYRENNMPNSSPIMKKEETQSAILSVFNTSDNIKNNRNITTILTHLTTEVGELAQEVQIVLGDSKKTSGDDGIIGESVDVILCALDMIRIYAPDVSEEEILTVINKKLNKWESQNY